MEEMMKIGTWASLNRKQEQYEAVQICTLKEAGCEKWSPVISYFPSSNAMPKMSASSSVILTREWVISGRISLFMIEVRHLHHYQVSCIGRRFDLVLFIRL